MGRSICVFGNFGVKNFGDDLILEAHRLRAKKKHQKLIVFCGNPDEVERSFGLKAYAFFPSGIRSFFKYLFSGSHRKLIRKGFLALKKTSRIELGGGGLLVDRKLLTLFLWFRQLQVIRKSQRPYHFVGNSFELESRWVKALFLPFLKGAVSISVRDTSSQELLKSMGIPSELAPDLSEIVPLSVPSKPERKKLILLSLCRWGLDEGKKRTLRHFINNKKKEGYEIRGIACQTLVDDDRKVFAELDPEIPVETSRDAIVSSVAEAEMLIGMRLHALIIAQRLKTPCVALSYQQKVSSFFSDQGLENLLIDLKNLKLDLLQAHFDQAKSRSSTMTEDAAL